MGGNKVKKKRKSIERKDNERKIKLKKDSKEEKNGKERGKKGETGEDFFPNR